jgi:putative drug exporter of the RND superfamily
VPASMKLLGEHNWYLPRSLQWLPHLDVEGHAQPPPPRKASPALGQGD